MHLYKADVPLYALGFKNTEEKGEEITFAVGSFCLDDPNGSNLNAKNKVEVVQLQAQRGLTKIHEIPHTYPVNKLQWAPPSFPGSRDFLCTGSDMIRVWNINNSGVNLAC